MNYKTYLGALMLAFLLVVTLIVAFDFIVYTIKSGAKSSTLAKWHWKLGLACAISLTTFYILYLCEA